MYNTLRKIIDRWPSMESAAPLEHHERKISMATFDTVREVRIALTVEDFDLAVQIYRDRLGLTVVEEWQRPEGREVILSLGQQTTLELFDGPQADFVDQVEVGQRVSGPVRLALAVPDADAAAARQARRSSPPRSRCPGATTMRASKRPMGCRSRSTRRQALRTPSAAPTKTLSSLRLPCGI